MGLRSRWAWRASGVSALGPRSSRRRWFLEARARTASLSSSRVISPGKGRLGGFEGVQEGPVAVVDAGLFGVESFERGHEAEPGAGLRAERAGVVAVVEGFDGPGADSVQLGEVLVVALDGFELVGGDAGEGAEDVDRREVVGDEAAGGEEGRLKRVWGFSRKVRWLPM
jgi:hypothetical protein